MKCNDFPVETQSPYSTLSATNRKAKILTNTNINVVPMHKKGDNKP